MNFYDIVLRQHDIENAIAQNGGEITPEIEQKELELARDLVHRLDDFTDYRESIKALIEKQKKQRDTFDKYYKATKNHLERLEKHAVQILEQDKDVINSEVQELSLKNNPHKVVIEDEMLIPAKYFKPQPKKLDLSEVKDDLKKGIKVPGAKLIQNKSLKFGRRKI